MDAVLDGSDQACEETQFNLVMAEEQPPAAAPGPAQNVLEVIGPPPKSVAEADEKWTNTLRNLTSEISFVKNSLQNIRIEGVPARAGDADAAAREEPRGTSANKLQSATGYNTMSAEKAEERLRHVANVVEHFITILSDLKHQAITKSDEMQKLRDEMISAEGHCQGKLDHMDKRLEEMDQYLRELKAHSGNAAAEAGKPPAFQRSASNLGASAGAPLNDVAHFIQTQKDHAQQILGLEKLQIDQREHIEQCYKRIAELDALLGKHSSSGFEQEGSEAVEAPICSAPSGRPSDMAAPNRTVRTAPLSSFEGKVGGTETQSKKRKNVASASIATPASVNKSTKKPKKKVK